MVHRETLQGNNFCWQGRFHFSSMIMLSIFVLFGPKFTFKGALGVLHGRSAAGAFVATPLGYCHPWWSGAFRHFSDSGDLVCLPLSSHRLWLVGSNMQEDRERYFVGLSLAVALLVISTVLAMLHQRWNGLPTTSFAKYRQYVPLPIKNQQTSRWCAFECWSPWQATVACPSDWSFSLLSTDAFAAVGSGTGLLFGGLPSSQANGFGMFQ